MTCVRKWQHEFLRSVLKYHEVPCNMFAKQTHFKFWNLSHFRQRRGRFRRWSFGFVPLVFASQRTRCSWKWVILARIHNVRCIGSWFFLRIPNIRWQVPSSLVKPCVPSFYWTRWDERGRSSRPLPWQKYVDKNALEWKGEVCNKLFRNFALLNLL